MSCVNCKKPFKEHFVFGGRPDQYFCPDKNGQVSSQLYVEETSLKFKTARITVAGVEIDFIELDKMEELLETFEIVKGFYKNPVKNCECGGIKAATTHSNWCPVYDK